MYNIEGFGTMFGGDLPAEIWHNFMAAAVAPYPATGFPTPVIGGTLINGTGTYSYAPYSYTTPYYSSTTPTTTG
jgi:hypothetical protein